jgi:hypothetical protein
VFPEALAGDHFTVDGHRVEIRRRVGDEGHSWLWIPSARTSLGGVYLADGQHLWVADSPTRDDRDKWLAALAAMDDLRPAVVMPAHFTPASPARPGVVGRDPIEFTRQYLTALEGALQDSKTAAGVISRMDTLYPGLPGRESLEMTARVLTGETPWKVVRAFPAIGRRVEIRRGVGDEGQSGVWIPSARTMLGGVYLADGQHLWVADSPAREDRDRWLAALAAMDDLRPEVVMPAHFTPVSPAKPGVVGRDPIEFTRQYLTALEGALLDSKTSAGVISRMDTLYPGLPGRESLEMTARVLTGETPWKVVRPFPAIGRRVEVDFGGEYLFELRFADHRTMSFRGLRQREGGRPMSDTVRYTATEIAGGIYQVYWTETDNTHVVHIEDYASGVVYTNIAAPDGSFTNLRGTLRLLE